MALATRYYNADVIFERLNVQCALSEPPNSIKNPMEGASSHGVTRPTLLTTLPLPFARLFLFPIARLFQSEHFERQLRGAPFKNNAHIDTRT